MAQRTLKTKKSNSKKKTSSIGKSKFWPLKKMDKRAILAVILVAAAIGTVTTLFGRAAPGCVDSAPCASSGTDVASKAWQLEFADEFNGTSLDQSKWATQRGPSAPGYGDPYNPDNEDAFYRGANVTVGGGNLALTLKKETAQGNSRSYPYTSGMIQSGRNYSFAPGTYIESRIKVPACDGCWPAFWTLDMPVDGHWPPEIDIFEFFGTGNGQDKKPQFNYHWGSGSQHGPKPFGENIDYTGNFHTYGLYWDGNKAIPYLDGVAYTAQGWSSNMTKVNQYIIFNLAIGRGGQSPSGQQMLVDWVRVWKPGTGTPVPNNPGTPVPPAEPQPNNPTPTPTPNTSYEIGVSAPTDGKSVSGNVTFSGTQSGLKNVEVWYNGANVATASLSGNKWSATVDTSKQTNGSQTYTVYGWDVAAGQQASNTVTQNVTLNVNNAAPAPAPVPQPTPTASYDLSINNPTTNQKVNGNITFSGTQSGLKNVEVWYNGANVGTATITNGTWSATVDSTKQANGAQTYTVYGWDVAAGQQASNTVTQNISVDIDNGNASTPTTPTPTIPAPTDGIPAVVSGTVKLPIPEGAKDVVVKVNGKRVKVSNGTINTRRISNGSYTVSIQYTDPTSGETVKTSTPLVIQNKLSFWDRMRNYLRSLF